MLDIDHVLPHPRTNTHVYLRRHAKIHTHTRMHGMHARMHARTHTRTHTHTYTQIPLNIRPHLCTHARVIAINPTNSIVGWIPVCLLWGLSKSCSKRSLSKKSGKLNCYRKRMVKTSLKVEERRAGKSLLSWFMKV